MKQLKIMSFGLRNIPIGGNSVPVRCPATIPYSKKAEQICKIYNLKFKVIDDTPKHSASKTIEAPVKEEKKAEIVEEVKEPVVEEKKAEIVEEVKEPVKKEKEEKKATEKKESKDDKKDSSKKKKSKK